MKPLLAVPKLDLCQVKNIVEMDDWQGYAMKLENSVKFLRERVEMLEREVDALKEKNAAER